MPKQIPLSGKCGAGRFAVVDDEDYERLARHRWHLQSMGYAARRERQGGKERMILMHREVIGVPPGLHTDHVNRDRLDNRAANLRACTRHENMRNMAPWGLSRYKGVSQDCVGRGDSRRVFWRATIKCDGRSHKLGRFPYTREGEIAAARAYDAAAREHFGEFAYLNFPEALEVAA